MPLTQRRKARQPHTKSRNGCARCKRQRRKCDERSPSCSRCAELNIDCHYPRTGQMDAEPRLVTENRRSRRFSGLSVDFSSPVDITYSPSVSTGTLHEDIILVPDPPHAMKHTSTRKYRSLSDLQHSKDAVQFPNFPPLDARDLELLTHYISHTSRIIPYDKADFYVLHIGIPNLAFSSKPLMSSMLALAAACQCYDLLPTTQNPRTLSLDQIGGLLSLADRHHRSSLTQIQDVIGAAQYDVVLANAVLMTLYGHAVHCVRIRLFDLHRQGRLGAGLLPREFVPAQSQWISLIRAVHCAYVGLRGDSDTEGVEAGSSPMSLPLVDDGLGSCGGVDDVRCPQDGPAETTRRLFLPIVSATVSGAMQKLRLRVQRLGETSRLDNTDFQTCVDALVVLESTLAEVFTSERDKSYPIATKSRHPHGSTDCKDSLGRLSAVAPWLRAYAARVTSNHGEPGLDLATSSASPPLRRTINAFLNRVDAVFLRLVQETLERLPFPEHVEAEEYPPDGSDSSRCAMDIFAHWLVLVCLLDAVWWIGDIGTWELGRVVACMEGIVGKKDREGEEGWWPESMFNIRMELKRQGF